MELIIPVFSDPGFDWQMRVERGRAAIAIAAPDSLGEPTASTACVRERPLGLWSDGPRRVSGKALVTTLSCDDPGVALWASADGLYANLGSAQRGKPCRLSVCFASGANLPAAWAVLERHNGAPWRAPAMLAHEPTAFLMNGRPGRSNAQGHPHEP